MGEAVGLEALRQPAAQLLGDWCGLRRENGANSLVQDRPACLRMVWERRA
jgi:hypothetical protein